MGNGIVWEPGPNFGKIKNFHLRKLILLLEIHGTDWAFDGTVLLARRIFLPISVNL